MKKIIFSAFAISVVAMSCTKDNSVGNSSNVTPYTYDKSAAVVTSVSLIPSVGNSNSTINRLSVGDTAIVFSQIAVINGTLTPADVKTYFYINNVVVDSVTTNDLRGYTYGTNLGSTGYSSTDYLPFFRFRIPAAFSGKTVRANTTVKFMNQTLQATVPFTFTVN